jgi:hypothetical protein
MPPLGGVMLTRWTIPLVCLLSGCPFVFGPPDLSRIDRQTRDSGTETETETGTETETDGALHAPIVVSMSLVPSIESLAVSFAVADTELDLVGGRVTLVSEGGEELELQIPEEIDHWDALGTSFISIPIEFLSCDDGYHTSWTLTVTDAAGHTSAPSSADLEIQALGLLPESPEDHKLGVLGGPTVMCVSYEYDEHDAQPINWQLQADIEAVRFGVGESGLYRVEAAWQSAMQVGLYLYADGYGAIGGYSYEYGASQRTIWGELEEGELYQLRPSFWSRNGADPPYEVTLLVLQE